MVYSGLGELGASWPGRAGENEREREGSKRQGQQDGRDRNRVRDLRAKEADEEADAL
ncbi:hypothetical protein WN51_08647 [Melipona quadrifasciata]|uniref:Uncharacterized protein n=1 Tax=Melipona quadrifasciata TaxID=166423 RepID=A0A0N0BJB7_9HYME|nr:hypothetical protein WN51_08647 [Melipona quadrifasciata]